jgi:hypothetical protein
MHVAGKTFPFLFLCTLCLGVCLSTMGQDNPFGADPGADTGSEAPQDDPFETSIRLALKSETNAVVRTLLTDPPKSPKDLAVAIKLMVRIKRWDEVSRWMKAIQSKPLDEKTAVEMVDAAGTRTFPMVESAGDELAPAERMLAQKIIQLANSYRFNPTLLANYATQMRSDNSATRLAGYRGIESTGRYGVAAFFANVMAADAPAPTPIMCEALTRLETPAFEAWCVAIQTPHDDAKLQLAKLAYGSRDPRFAPALGSLIADSDPTNEGWNPLRQAWEQSTSFANRQELVRLSSEKLAERLGLYLRSRFANDAATSIRWSLGPTGRTLDLAECRPAEALWSHLTFEADNVLRYVARPDETAALAYVVMAQNSVSVEQQTTLRSRAKSFLESAEFCAKAWDLSVKHDLAQAQRMILDDLGQYLVPFSPAIRERMIAALDSGYSTVRYTAASQLIEYLLTLDANESRVGLFGQSKLERVAEDMLSLNVRPTAYVIGGSSSLRNHLKTLLEASNVIASDFNNAAGAITSARQNGAVDQIYVVSSVFEMSVPQLVQRLRATPVGSKAPIVMLADSLNASSVEFLLSDPRVVIGSVPPDETGLAFLLEKVALIQEHSAPISPTDRLLWREKAEAFFARNQPK